MLGFQPEIDRDRSENLFHHAGCLILHGRDKMSIGRQQDRVRMAQHPSCSVLTGVVFAVIGAVGLLIPDVIHIEEQASEHAGPFRFPAVGKA